MVFTHQQHSEWFSILIFEVNIVAEQ